MEYSNLGVIGLKGSRICLGMMGYGSSKLREWELVEDQARPVLGHEQISNFDKQ